jgi:hypothetical protein
VSNRILQYLVRVVTKGLTNIRYVREHFGGLVEEACNTKALALIGINKIRTIIGGNR